MGRRRGEKVRTPTTIGFANGPMAGESYAFAGAKPRQAGRYKNESLPIAGRYKIERPS